MSLHLSNAQELIQCPRVKRNAILKYYRILIKAQIAMTLKWWLVTPPPHPNKFCYWQKKLSSKTLKNWYHFLASKCRTDTKYFMICFHMRSLLSLCLQDWLLRLWQSAGYQIKFEGSWLQLDRSKAGLCPTSEHTSLSYPSPTPSFISALSSTHSCTISPPGSSGRSFFRSSVVIWH